MVQGLTMACLVVVVVGLVGGVAEAVVEGLGVNWGTMASHQMLPEMVVRMMRDNGIRRVKIFDADPWTLKSLEGSEMEVMVAIPNDMLGIMQSYENAKEWVDKNVTRYTHPGGVNIRYVAVGNEAFLKAYKGRFMNTTFPALQNIQKALNEAGHGHNIKVTTPLNADVYNSPDSNPVPSAGTFRSDIQSLMTDIVRFLDGNSSPFVVNIYPFLSLNQNPNFPVDFAFFDGGATPLNDNGVTYNNVFDANYDTLVHALQKAGVPNMKIVVGEVGWPTDGVNFANISFAKRFYDGFLKKMASGKGTPLRPGNLDVYLFGLIDEDQKSVLPGDFERHWGIFRYDGQPKFPIDLSGGGNDRYLVPAKGVQYVGNLWCVFNKNVKNQKKLKQLGGQVSYACTLADCTALNYGGSCNGLDQQGNVSYAFNQYFQLQDQDIEACSFKGLGVVTKVNASSGGCLFPVQIVSGSTRAAARVSFLLLLWLLVVVPTV